jgi:hypothetical protein
MSLCRMVSVKICLACFTLLWVTLHLVICQADSSEAPDSQQQALSGCGDLAGSCNAQVCCCNNGGFITQTPTPEGTCKAKPSSSVGGTIFLVVAGLIPAITSFLLFKLTSPLQLKSASVFLSQVDSHRQHPMRS